MEALNRSSRNEPPATRGSSGWSHPMISPLRTRIENGRSPEGPDQVVQPASVPSVRLLSSCR